MIVEGNKSIYILAHRGAWKNKNDGNSYESLTSALITGFGIETDIRDYCGEIIISHDVPTTNVNLKLETLLEFYSINNCTGKLALNIKSDGLISLLQILLKKYNIKNYFLFDMSIPETVKVSKSPLIFYTRKSDLENELILMSSAQGIWLDQFLNNWLSSNEIEKLLKLDKKIAVVSPELHGRDHLDLWHLLKTIDLTNIELCTDYPFEAQEFFKEKV